MFWTKGCTLQSFTTRCDPCKATRARIVSFKLHNQLHPSIHPCLMGRNSKKMTIVSADLEVAVLVSGIIVPGWIKVNSWSWWYSSTVPSYTGPGVGPTPCARVAWETGCLVAYELLYKQQFRNYRSVLHRLLHQHVQGELTTTTTFLKIFKDFQSDS